MEHEHDSVKHFEKLSKIVYDIQCRCSELSKKYCSVLSNENMDIYTGSTYFRLILFLFTVVLICVTMLSGHTEVVYVDDVTAVRTYVIKNSSKHAEDNALSTDPDLIMDYDQPGAFWLPSQEVYFTSAFLDTRYNASTVRIIGLQHRDHKMAPKCRFRLGNQSVMVQAGVELIYPYWPGKSLYLAAIYHCDTPVVNFDLTSIQVCSLKELPCVKIPLNHPKREKRRSWVDRKGELAVCGKAYSGELDPSRLIEWFEMNRLAGVSSVIVYDNGIRGWANQVIDHYKSIKFVKTVSFPLLGLLHDHAIKHFKLSKEEYFSISQQVYLASLNDCIYRFLHRYEFFLIIDYDELLLPYRDESIYFMALRHSAQRPSLSGLTFYTAWHFSDFESTANTSSSTANNNSTNTTPSIDAEDRGARLYILDHNRRTNIINNQPKSVVMAGPVLSVNWHGVIRSHPSSKHGLNALILPTTDSAYVHHYRGRCVEKFLMTDCNVMLRQGDVDAVVPRYGSRLHIRVKDMYKVLGMRSPVGP